MSDQHNDQTRGEFVEDVTADRTQPTAGFGDGEKLTPEKVGEAAVKFASETAFAAAGVADLIAAKAREFFDTQRRQLAEKTPEGIDPNFKQFVDGMPDQFKVFLDEVTRQYHDMAERGRSAVSDFSQQVKESRAARPDGAFDVNEGVDADDADTVVAPEFVEETTTDTTFLDTDVPPTAPEDAAPDQTWPGESNTEHRD
ncbi:hypothetical protein PCC79_14175 [Propioniciclava soli]|uniref:Uncharacterized protein n=1 Tax=Propioniciclava soli TaxID=2775081 RepID=A0ABZ3C672_9ACTN